MWNFHCNLLLANSLKATVPSRSTPVVIHVEHTMLLARLDRVAAIATTTSAAVCTFFKTVCT